MHSGFGLPANRPLWHSSRPSTSTFSPHPARHAAAHHRQPPAGTSCHAVGGRDSLTLKFSIPYRCEFGQHLRLVGTSEHLGDWDLRRSLPMTWTEGDVWTAEIKLSANRTSPLLEYKYVVCHGDGGDAAWKPGSNFVLTMPTKSKSKVQIKDAWDETSREVQIEVQTARFRRPRQEAEDGASASDSEGEAVAAITTAANKALDQLDDAVSMSVDLMDRTEDAASPELLAADRMVAAAQRRATALGRALDASANPSVLTVR